MLEFCIIRLMALRTLLHYKKEKKKKKLKEEADVKGRGGCLFFQKKKHFAAVREHLKHYILANSFNGSRKKILPGDAAPTKTHSNQIGAFELVTGSIFFFCHRHVPAGDRFARCRRIWRMSFTSLAPPVATTERPRPPSSLNNSTIKARAATRADITQTAAATFCGVGR